MKLPVSGLHCHWLRTAIHVSCTRWSFREVADVVRAKVHRELRQATPQIRRTIKRQTEENRK